uniref:Transmembrane protein n=1 Tax=Chromera velia CCMP2878 TaxID=1169474 RepID=A0A0G4HKY4_9ALVE|eukprot:Cvel_7285.t1-p1 / transcript=Cvel_7285.t1 / gene=Cvel_7285 / organism=Chromera_velia_CCMP2878 / gene_product=hypothetical protein / transcript_product=hypothetical protein / location=Cvel_scaffold376:62725-70130(+) / protein_length=598 / sequence_SO=supercontig / SO=protein_coding / is_pseudo=false
MEGAAAPRHVAPFLAEPQQQQAAPQSYTGGPFRCDGFRSSRRKGNGIKSVLPVNAPVLVFLLAFFALPLQVKGAASKASATAAAVHPHAHSPAPPLSDLLPPEGDGDWSVGAVGGGSPVALLGGGGRGSLRARGAETMEGLNGEKSPSKQPKQWGLNEVAGTLTGDLSFGQLHPSASSSEPLPSSYSPSSSIVPAAFLSRSADTLKETEIQGRGRREGEATTEQRMERESLTPPSPFSGPPTAFTQETEKDKEGKRKEGVTEAEKDTENRMHSGFDDGVNEIYEKGSERDKDLLVKLESQHRKRDGSDEERQRQEEEHRKKREAAQQRMKDQEAADERDEDEELQALPDDSPVPSPSNHKKERKEEQPDSAPPAHPASPPPPPEKKSSADSDLPPDHPQPLHEEDVEGGKQKSGGETDEARKEAEDKAKEKESEVAEKLKELAEKKKELEDSKKALKDLLSQMTEPPEMSKHPPPKVKKEEVGVEEERALKEETEYAENVAQNHHHAPPELLCKLQERLVKAQDEEWGDQVVEFQTALAQMATRLRDMKAKREKACHEAVEGGEEGDKKSGGVSFGSVPPSSSLLLGAFCVLASSLKI